MIRLTAEQFADATGAPLEAWAGQCHAASIALVKSGAVGTARVARGTCRGVAGQHSWVVLGNDCYDRHAEIIDPTLWSWTDDVTGIWHGHAHDRPHVPFGAGSIWHWGRPRFPEDAIITLEPAQPWSSAAEAFLDILGPLDFTGWVQLAHAPVEAWPAGEIIAAMYQHDQLRNRIPIDIVGMTTHLNPGGLYLPEEGDRRAA